MARMKPVLGKVIRVGDGFIEIMAERSTEFYPEVGQKILLIADPGIKAQPPPAPASRT